MLHNVSVTTDGFIQFYIGPDQFIAVPDLGENTRLELQHGQPIFVTEDIENKLLYWIYDPASKVGMGS